MKREDFDSRIKELPFAMKWKNTIGGFMDGIREDGIINYECLSDAEKLCLYVYAWNKAEFLPSKKGILRTFGWTDYRLQKVIKELNGQITTEATMDEDTGLLSGSGYFYQEKSLSSY
jgi:hypothetical protein